MAKEKGNKQKSHPAVIKRNYTIIILLTVLSGLILGASSYFFAYPLGWIGYVPLFYLIIHNQTSNPFSLKAAFLLGFAAAVIQGMVIFSWMQTVSNNYTGQQSSWGYLYSAVSAAAVAVKTGGSLLLFSLLAHKYRNNARYNTLILMLASASAFVVLDWLFTQMFADLPWLFHFIGYTQSTNLYMSQLAEIGGVWLLTSAVISINLLFGIAIAKKQLKYGYTAMALIALLHMYGYFRIETLVPSTQKKINVALICDNTKPEIRWNPSLLQEYVSKLFKLNKEALTKEADLIIWNEGVLPWSFRKDDDFLKEILLQSRQSTAPDHEPFHLISYFTSSQINPKESYNSAYLVKADGNIEGRYDKHQLLGAMEKPLWNIDALQLSFFNPADNNRSIESPKCDPISWGKKAKIGVFICNESLTDNIAAELAGKGADFLVLMANDNWFANTQLTFHHFYTSRLRAIECRKDLVINANLGFSGIITSTGEIKTPSERQDAQVIVAQVSPNSTYSQYPLRKTVFLSLSFIILIITLLKTKQHETQ